MIKNLFLPKTLKFLTTNVEGSIFLSWIVAIHIFELIVLPSMIFPTQVLSHLTLTERLVQIWTIGADSIHYMNLAQTGYTPSAAPFFPLWPLVIKALGASPIIIKITVAILTFLFILLFSRLMKNLGYGKVRKEAIVAFLAFPVSFMLLSAMTEPLFLVLAVTTMLLAEKRRFLPAAIFAALASATKFFGIVLTLYLFLKIIEGGSSNFKKWWWTLLISPLGLVFYSLYLQFAFGDFSLLYRGSAEWGRHLGTSAIEAFLNESKDLIFQLVGPVKPLAMNLIQFGSILFFLAILIISYKKINKALWIYSLLSVALPLASGTFQGVPRYILPAFPLFMAFGAYLSKNTGQYYLYLFLSLLLQSIIIIRFFNFEWVS